MQNPPDMSWTALRDLAVDAARAASLALLKWVDAHDDELGVEHKGDGSPVSQADYASHATIVRALAASNLPVLSEEGEEVPWEVRRHWTWFWVVDPLDGTEAFLRYREGFAVNIALCGPEGPVIGVVADPCGGQIFSGLTDHGAHAEPLDGGPRTALHPQPAQPPYCLVTSRNERAPLSELLPPGFSQDEVVSEPVSGALKFCLVASGEADIHSRTGSYMEWDCAAGDGVLRAMGLAVRDAATGAPLTYNKPSLWVHGLWVSRVQR